MLRPGRVLTGGLAAGAALWTTRHATAPAVRAWAPPVLPGRRWGRLYARSGGDGPSGVVLLHGLVATGDVFGAAFDQLATDRRLVVPDLLGFGRSLDETRDSFGVGDHLDALDELADQTGLFEADRLIIGAHSMGASLALRWAGRHGERVDRVVCWGAPIYTSAEMARARISGSVMARLFVLDTGSAQRACALSCAHRRAAGWVAAGLAPRHPVPVARSAALHSWPAYRDAMNQLVIGTDWADLLDELASSTAVVFARGSGDLVGDPAAVQALAMVRDNTEIVTIPGAGHDLPMSRPDMCVDQLSGDDGHGDGE